MISYFCLGCSETVPAAGCKAHQQRFMIKCSDSDLPPYPCAHCGEGEFDTDGALCACCASKLSRFEYNDVGERVLYDENKASAGDGSF